MCLTVLATMAGDGSFLDPYFVYPNVRKHEWKGWKRRLKFGFSERVLVTGETVLLWLETQFLPESARRQVKLPVVLLVLGRRSHINLAVSELCLKKFCLFYLFSPKYYASPSICKRWVLQASKRSLEKSHRQMKASEFNESFNSPKHSRLLL